MAASEGQVIETCSTITTTPNWLYADVHDGLMREARKGNSKRFPSPMPKRVLSVVEKFRERYGGTEREEVLLQTRCGGRGELG